MNLEVKQTSDHPLARMTKNHDALFELITERLLAFFSGASLKEQEQWIDEAVYLESQRLQTATEPSRDAEDMAFLKMIQTPIRELKRTQSTESRVQVASDIQNKLIRYHLDEIFGHFDPWTYDLATTLVPKGLTWLLKAQSWSTFDKVMTSNPSLSRNVLIQGQIQELRSLSQQGTILLVPTHFSNLDSVLVGWALQEIGLPPFSYGAGLNLFSNPILSYFMGNLGAYRVDRRKKHLLYRELLKEYSTLSIEQGCHSLFFPGGGRSRSGALETKLKLGLLGTGLRAYTKNLLSGALKPKVFIVPCVISYHFVLEASSLIHDFLASEGRSQYFSESRRPFLLGPTISFLSKLFGTSSKIYINFGQALDPFGNPVTPQGESLTPSGRVLDTRRLVETNGLVGHLSQRDHEYNLALQNAIVERYQKDNIVLTSHVLAHVYFRCLSKSKPYLHLYELVRLPEEDTEVEYDSILKELQNVVHLLHKRYAAGLVQLEPTLRSTYLANIVDTGLRHLGLYHSKRPILRKLRIPGSRLLQERGPHSGEDKDLCFYSQDVRLLYYYSNRAPAFLQEDLSPVRLLSDQGVLQ